MGRSEAISEKNFEAHRDPRLLDLSADEVAMLRAFPYERAGVVRGTREVKIAQRLIDVGLLERNPEETSVMRVRCTANGERAAKPITRQLARLVVAEVRETEQSDEEAADSIRHALWRRVLVELANEPNDVEIGSVAELARIALSAEARWI